MSKTIKHICEYMIEEAESSVCYAKMAIEHQYTKPQLADLMYKLAQTELQHSKTLKEHRDNLKIEFENQKGDRIPEWMKEEYDCCNKKYICLIEKAQSLISLY